jgi:adenine deaminase
MYVLLREGTSAKNLRSLVSGITPATLRRILFCTDDRDINDILESGTISNCVATAIECGIDPIDAITIATLNAAECYGLQGKGAVAPGIRRT